MHPIISIRWVFLNLRPCSKEYQVYLVFIKAQGIFISP